MARGVAEKVRILLSRLVMGSVGVLVLFSSSAWKDSLVSAGLLLAGCALVAVGTIGRIWATLYVAGRKTKSLVTAGPYSLCRNPLYFFSLVGGLGVAMTTQTLVIPALFALPFALYYPWVIRSEERRLREAHGTAFDDYCRMTPAFWPKLSGLREEVTYTVNAVSFRKHLLDALWFIWLVGAIDFIGQLHALGWVPSPVALR